MKTRKNITLLLMLMGLTLFFYSCDEDTFSYDTSPPSPPTNVRTYSYDGEVEIHWSAPPERDLQGFNIYYAEDYWGEYTLIGSTPNTSFVDYEAVNGEKYYYGVAAYDFNNNESELSYDEVYGIARPEGTNEIVYDYITQPDLAGFSFAEESIVSYNDYLADFFFENYEGVFYLNVWEEFDIQDMGRTDDIYDITEAPTGGWVPILPDDNVKYVEAKINHTYVIWTVDNHYAKIRVSQITPERMVFDWAFQLIPGEKMLKKNVERKIHSSPSTVRSR